MDAFLGIDTSCYTTSLCVVDSHFDVVADERIILTVPQGGRGLSQSNMVYQHMRNLPVLFERLAPQLESCAIRAVGVTDKPRRREDSYMPAFLAGLGYGRSLAAVLRVPMYTVSHQENHLLAALRATGSIGQEAFYGLHLSGGTTDLVPAGRNQFFRSGIAGAAAYCRAQRHGCRNMQLDAGHGLGRPAPHAGRQGGHAVSRRRRRCHVERLFAGRIGGLLPPPSCQAAAGSGRL